MRETAITSKTAVQTPRTSKRSREKQAKAYNKIVNLPKIYSPLRRSSPQCRSNSRVTIIHIFLLVSSPIPPYSWAINQNLMVQKDHSCFTGTIAKTPQMRTNHINDIIQLFS
jgi:hypothetical protein